MAFVVSSLTNYVKDNAEKLVAKSYFDSKTYSRLRTLGANIQTGIKTSERIHLIATDTYFQSDSGCGFNASGDVTISPRTITVGAIKVNKSFCPKDLRAKYTQVLLKPGSMDENDMDGAWAKDVADTSAAGIGEELEKAYWQGDTDSGNPNLSKFDGLLKQGSVANGATQANTNDLMGTAITSYSTSNIRTAVDAVWRSFTEGVKGKTDAVVCIGTDLFDLYIASLTAANLYHFAPGQVESYELTIPGTGYKLIGFPGLSGTNKIQGFRTSNVYFGADLENEEEEFKMWESLDDDNVKMKVLFKAGVNFAYVNEVVLFSLA